MRMLLSAAVFLALVLSGCNLTAGPATETATAVPSSTATETPVPPTQTATMEPTATATETELPTETLSPTPEVSPTPSDTATPQPLTATATGNAFCRWGPDVDYIDSYTIPSGQTVAVEGRNFSGTWIYVQSPDINWKCWVAVSTFELSGDVEQVEFRIVGLPINEEVQAPNGVSATRNGNQVTITWNAVQPALQLQYLIVARVCQNGLFLEDALATTNTSITIQDDQNCANTSSAELRASNKLGYSPPVTIPWP